MRQATAKSLADLFVKQTAEQIDLLKSLETLASDEVSEVRDMIGKTLGALYLDALQPIFEAYPMLKPAHFP